MTKLLWISVALLGSAVSIGVWQGGARGGGIVFGTVAGAGLTLLALFWQRHVLQHRPERVFAATLQGFLVKLFVMALIAISLRHLPMLSARADWRAFLVSFVIAVLALQSLGTLENLRLCAPKERRAS
jgi:hypothetical protein